ncbi:NAD(P)-dependent oxidoreductase [Actinokineospora guangxiensis]|uniref:NAD(P)-dependent oxidoreductase n=1 Tax=Actinokineospora guangxiensis TaxID=1490288 RepID=A0ABW0ENN0_9PSEU
MSDTTLIGLGAMGTALAAAWLAAGHRPTVWNRTRARAENLGAPVADTPADAVAASRLVVVCLLDDAGVGAVLDGVDLAGKDLVNLTTCTPAEARARAAWAGARGARYLDGGIMADPPMIGTPDASVFYSGSAEAFTTWEHVLAVPAATRYVGEDPGHAALHDIALLSAMYGMFAGIAHAFALIRAEPIAPTSLAPLLADWLSTMAGSAHLTAAQLETGDYRAGVSSTLAMQVAGIPTFLRTAREQAVRPDLLTPYFTLMHRLAADGRGDEDTTGVVDLLR